VRAENFIAHARSLRKPLNLKGYNTRDFHKTKEAYARRLKSISDYREIDWVHTFRILISANASNCGTKSKSSKSAILLMAQENSIRGLPQ